MGQYCEYGKLKHVASDIVWGYILDIFWGTYPNAGALVHETGERSLERASFLELFLLLTLVFRSSSDTRD